MLIPYFTMHKMFPAAKENMLVVVAKPGLLAAAIDEVRVGAAHPAAMCLTTSRTIFHLHGRADGRSSSTA